jgi:ATP dependent DNA ligase domain
MPLPRGFIQPCLPTKAPQPPTGDAWLHEIKHDGFRMLVRRDAAGVRLFTRNGHDWTGRFPLIARAALALRATSCLIDGEAVACGDNGLPVFDRLRYRRQDGWVFLYAFDLLELDGDDLRREPIERRKVLLIRLLAKASVGLQVNDHIVQPGDVVLLGFEGIVSKRLGSPYGSGRSRHWVKSKNPAAPAVKREAEEDWGERTTAMTEPDPSRHILRVSVRVLGKEPIKGLEAEPSITVERITVTVKQRWPFLILMAGDFDSEAEAEAFLPRIKGGLWNIAIEHNIAFDPDFERRPITRSANPEQAGRNVAKTFGGPIKEPVKPLHGLGDEGGYTIFQSGENIKYFAMGGATAYVSTGRDPFSKTLAEGIQNARLGAKEQDTSLATAIDVYLAHFYETSIRARFLTLMMCLEVLAPRTERHPTAVQLLSEFKGQVQAQSVQVEGEEGDALEALLREIDFKKETSIRRRLRSLVLEEAPLAKDARIGLAKEVVDAYDLRGSIVHSATVDSQALNEANETALKTVKLLLRARLGLAEQPQN